MKIPQNVTPSDHSFTISKLQQTAQAKASVSKSSAPSVGQYDSAKMNDLAEEFSGKNSEHASPDMRRICSLFTNNQSFRTFLEENTKFSICEKAPEGDRQVAPPGVSRENILREMLKGGEELTPTELNDFEKLLRNELTEHPEKWAAELATFADVDPAALSPKEEKYIEDMLAVLDEYNHIKDKNGDGSNATHYTPFAVDTDWLKLKDKTLLSSEAPRPEGVKEDDVLRVSPDAMMQVRDAQMAIGYLKQHVDSEYSGKLERNIADGGANHIEVCIQTMGQALAESVTALCKTTVHEDTSPDSALYWQQENAIVEILARDTVELLGEEGAMALLGDNTRSDFDKMRAEIFRLPDEQKVVRQKEMQKKLQEALTTHLTAVAKKDAGLSKDLGALTKKAMDKNSKAKLASLKVSAASIQHAINKSRHLREKIEKWGNTETKEKYAALLTAMKNCEKTLDKTLTKLNRFAPGVTDNLKTAGIGLLYKAWDGSLANHYNKKWQGIKNGLSSVGNKINNVRKEADGFLFSKMNISRSLPENKKTELSTLLIPLEDSADQLRTVAQPLQTAAEKLERVLRHHDKDFDAKIHNRVKINAKKEAQKNADNAGMILATMLNVALEKNGSLTRLENKKQEREEKVNILRDHTLKVLSHVKDKLEDELEKNITTLSDTFSNSGVAREYIELARKLAKNMTEQLESMEITLVAAELADENKMGSIAGEIAKTAKKVVEQADQLSADIKLITGKVLGIQFGYGPYEKNMVRYLVPKPANSVMRANLIPG